MDINKLIDDAKSALGIETDYALAKILGLDNKRLYDYRKGHRQPDAYAATRLALAVGRDPLAVIAEIEAAVAKTEPRRSFWRDFLSSAAKSTERAATVLLMPIGTWLAVAVAADATRIQCILC